MRKLRYNLVTAVAAMTLASTPAMAVDFTFSFSTDLTDPAVLNGVAGTVTGRVLGLTDNATSAATSVFIDSYSVGGFSAPTNATLWSFQEFNSFTVVGGLITNATFHADDSSGGFDRLYINLDVGYVNGFTNYASTGVSNRASIWNNNGLQGLTFSGSSAVPEPASWALMIGGFALVGASLRRKVSIRRISPDRWTM